MHGARRITLDAWRRRPFAQELAQNSRGSSVRCCSRPGPVDRVDNRALWPADSAACPPPSPSAPRAAFRAAVRADNLPVGVPAVPGPADHREADPAVVRRLLGRVDHRARVLPVDAARGLRLRGLDNQARRAAPDDAAHRAARRVAAVAADPRLAGLEAAWRRRAHAAHPAAADGDDRPALLPAFDDDAAAAVLVLEALPQRRAIPTVRAVELRIAARAARLPRPARTVVRPRRSRLGLVGAVRRLRRSVRGDRLGVAARRAATEGDPVQAADGATAAAVRRRCARS